MTNIMKPCKHTDIKIGDIFNAYVPQYNNKLVIGCPCTCTKNEIHIIGGIDIDGEKRLFTKDLFTFEIIKKKEKKK
jgi:hypothetical protein